MAGVGGHTTSGRIVAIAGVRQNTALGTMALQRGSVPRATTSFTPTIDSGVFIATSTGAYLSDGGVWTDSSDVNGKRNIDSVDVAEVLANLLELPISTWRPIDAPSVEHMGPMAQDFYAGFVLGKDDRHIAALDLSGAAVAAIQGMYAEMEEQTGCIEDLEAENAHLRELVEDLVVTVAEMRGE